jgi:hypothetical protein
MPARPLRGRCAPGFLFARLPAPMSPARAIRPSDDDRPPRSSRKRFAGSPTRVIPPPRIAASVSVRSRSLVRHATGLLDLKGSAAG